MPEALESRDVEITGAVILPSGEHQTFLAAGQLPDRYLDRLNKYTEAVTPPRSSMISEYKALLVISEDGNDGTAVCGKDRVSYASVFPGAREWLDRRIKQMADYVCEFSRVPGAKLPHHLEMENVGKIFDSTVTSDNGIGELLQKELEERDEITDIIMHQDCFEINYYLNNVQDCVDPGQRFMTLLGLIGCNLEEVYLCHCDEDHELASVVELNDRTLTEQGKKDWADVLNAKVERIYQGSYGAQIGLSGVEAERLTDFSYMLAGYVSSKDYERWVNDEERNSKDVRLAEQHFTKRMQEIGGDTDKTPEWLDHIWHQSEWYANQNNLFRAAAYQKLMKEFADGFAAVDRDFESCAFDIFNYKAAYHPDQLYKIAEWICEGGSAEDAYLTWGKEDSPEITAPDGDEDEESGMTMTQ
jgi:hypothetical protein